LERQPSIRRAVATVVDRRRAALAAAMLPGVIF